MSRGGRLGRVLGKVFNLGPIPWGGDADVINQGAVLPLAPLAATDNIPSLRAVFDVGAWHNSRFVAAGRAVGQSAVAALRRSVRAVAARRGRADRVHARRR